MQSRQTSCYLWHYQLGQLIEYQLKMSEKTETSDDPMIKLAIVIGKGLYRTVYALKDTLDEVGRGI